MALVSLRHPDVELWLREVIERDAHENVCATAVDLLGEGDSVLIRRGTLFHWLRHCARPPLAMDGLSKAGSALVYHCAKPHSKALAGGKVAKLVLTPLELINRIAALVPPPRAHQHRYFGVLAPNSPIRAAVTAMALAQTVTTQAETDSTGTPGVALQSHAVQVQPKPADPVPPKRSPAHYLWAVLIAHIYEVFPLLCPMCGGQMRLISFITDGAVVRKILEHIGVDSELPAYISRTRTASGTTVTRSEEVPPDWDLAAQAAPDHEVGQRVNW